MQLFSEIAVPRPNFSITYKDRIFCLGSCFVSEMGQKLQQAKFDVMVNPFGTQFHPVAMQNVFSRIYSRTAYHENEIFNHNGLFFSWDHGKQFSGKNLAEALEKVNETVEAGNAFLANTDIFIFTLGTAWAYQLRDANYFVSNCHKVPQRNFQKKLLTFERVYSAVKQLILMALDVRPTAKILFTISPVRHMRDGFFENNVSKGLLHNVMHLILEEYPEVNYFPSYEIVMDELRDYRYFGADLVHLNELGVNYVWEKFNKNYFNDETIKLMREVGKINLALEHHSQNPGGTEHKTFLYKTLKTAEKLAVQLPKNALNSEIEELKKRLHAY